MFDQEANQDVGCAWRKQENSGDVTMLPGAHEVIGKLGVGERLIDGLMTHVEPLRAQDPRQILADHLPGNMEDRPILWAAFFADAYCKVRTIAITFDHMFAACRARRFSRCLADRKDGESLRFFG